MTIKLASRMDHTRPLLSQLNGGPVLILQARYFQDEPNASYEVITILPRKISTYIVTLHISYKGGV
jgi:hypothetical protein